MMSFHFFKVITMRVGIYEISVSLGIAVSIPPPIFQSEMLINLKCHSMTQNLIARMIAVRVPRRAGINDIPHPFVIHRICWLGCLALGRDGLGHFDFSFFGLPPSFPFSAEDLAFASDLRAPRFLASVLAVMVLPQWGHFIGHTCQTMLFSPQGRIRSIDHARLHRGIRCAS